MGNALGFWNYDESEVNVFFLIFRLSGNPNGFLTPRANKTVNLVVNVPPASPPLKKDNLESSKDLNITSDGTLQKIKKTYI